MYINDSQKINPKFTKPGSSETQTQPGIHIPGSYGSSIPDSVSYSKGVDEKIG